MNRPAFSGFPAIARATAVPNIFLETVLPDLASPDALLAFLWVSRLVQEQEGEARCVAAGDVWGSAAARRSFERLARGRPGLDAGLEECVQAGALLRLDLTGASGGAVYFVNNPGSRRAVSRVRSGQLQIRPGTRVAELDRAATPGIFRLYEEQVGTITPMVAERLVELADAHPPDWIEDAFREAALRGVRNLRYVERILETWAQEGRANEGTPADSLADRKRKLSEGRIRPRGPA